MGTEVCSQSAMAGTRVVLALLRSLLLAEHVGTLKRMIRNDLLTSDPTNHAGFSRMGLCSLVVGAHGFDQAFVEPAHWLSRRRMGCRTSKEHDLFHGPGASAGQPRVIQGTARLSHCWSPSEVRRECGSRWRVVDRADSGNDGSCCHRPVLWERQKNFPFTCVLDNGDNLLFQLLDVLAQELEFFDQLTAFQHQATLSTAFFHSDALGSQSLHLQQFGGRERADTTSDLLQGRD